MAGRPFNRICAVPGRATNIGIAHRQERPQRQEGHSGSQDRNVLVVPGRDGWLGVKLHMQLSNEAGQSQVMVDSDVKGGDWNAQLKLGSPSFLGLNYFQVRS